MTRTYATAVDSYLSEPVLEFRLLADLTFTNTTMRVWTGVGSLMVGATHYDGIGLLGGIERVEETSESFTPQVKMWLSAVHSGTLSEAINETLFGKPVTLRRAWLNNGTIVNTPETWFVGQMGEVNVVRGDEDRGNYVEVSVQTRLDRSKKPRYYSKNDLWMTYSGDTFFNYLDQIQNQKAMWGTRRTGFGNTTKGNGYRGQ